MQWRKQPLSRRLVLGFLALSMLFVGIIFSKTVVEAMHEYRRAEVADEQGKADEARLHYERTIKFHTPFSATTPRAMARLWELGASAEAQGNVPLALEAYNSLRSGLYAIRSFYSPHKRWIAKSEAKIASLMAHTTNPGASHTTHRIHDVARFQQMLQRETAPRLGWSLVTEVGFLGWLGATVGFIWQAPTSTGGWAWRPSLIWGGGGVLCFSLWIIGMLLA